MHPELLSFNLPLFNIPVTIYTYGFMIAIGFVAATYITSLRSKKYKIDKNIVFDAFFYMILAGIFGARILFVLLNWNHYIISPLEIFYVHQGGLVFYGGLIGGTLGLIFYTRIKKIDLLTFTDLIIPQIPLAHFFGRLGCFSYGCCFGKVFDYSFFSVRFPENSPAYIQHINNFLIDKNYTHSLPVLPTQLIEAFFLLSFFLLLILLSKKVKVKGYLTSYYFMSYPIFRFLIEFLRGDDRGTMLFNMFSISQFISILLFVFGLNLFFVLKRKRINC